MKDVVVIGGGHNGLVAAALLAQAGRNVLLLEQRPDFGGRCACLEFHTAYKVPGLLHDTGGFQPEVARQLGLERDGLKWSAQPPTLIAGDGEVMLRLAGGEKGASAGVEQHHPSDLAGFRRWRQQLDSFRPAVRQLLSAPPPPLMPRAGADLWKLGKQGLALRRLGKDGLLELLRVFPMSVSDWLGEFLDSPLLIETLAFPAVLGGFVGPRAAGTASNLLFQECTAGPGVSGGPAALTKALEAACRRTGVEMRNSAAAVRIGISRGRVTDVELATGEKIQTGTVLAACHPRTALLDLVAPAELPLRLEDQVRSIRTRGTAAKVHIGLSSPMSLPEGLGAEVGCIRLGSGSPNGLERIFDSAKYRQSSPTFHLDVSLPARSSPDLAPGGGDVLSAWVHVVPYSSDPEWNRQKRAQLGEAAIERLTCLDPDLAQKVEALQVLTPWDLEAGFGLVGGQIFHVERALDQSLMLRPAAALARYATPIPGLYLGGSGCHPGGEVSGMPGFLAARTILEV